VCVLKRDRAREKGNVAWAHTFDLIAAVSFYTNFMLQRSCSACVPRVVYVMAQQLFNAFSQSSTVTVRN